MDYINALMSCGVVRFLMWKSGKLERSVEADGWENISVRSLAFRFGIFPAFHI
jgi:hypothetical protein